MVEKVFNLSEYIAKSQKLQQQLLLLEKSISTILFRNKSHNQQLYDLEQEFQILNKYRINEKNKLNKKLLSINNTIAKFKSLIHADSYRGNAIDYAQNVRDTVGYL